MIRSGSHGRWWDITLLASLLLAVAPVQAGVVIDSTRVIYNASAGEKTVKLRNDGGNPVLTQNWIDAGDPDMKVSQLKVPFILEPALQRIECNQEQALRIRAIPIPSLPLPTDREAVYYLNVLEIPPEPGSAGSTCSQGAAGQQDAPASANGSGNSLQLAIRSRIKLFYRPAGLKGDPSASAEKLQWTVSGGVLRVENPTAYHVNLTAVSMNGVDAKSTDMVPPFGAIELPMKSAVRAGVVSFSWLNDYGTTKDAKATALGAGQ